MLTGSYRSYWTLETLRAGSLDESVQIRPLAVGLVYLRITGRYASYLRYGKDQKYVCMGESTHTGIDIDTNGELSWIFVSRREQ